MKVGMHGFDGACAPRHDEVGPAWTTFSVGIFQWVSAKGDSKIKRGKVKVRVIGPTSYPDLVNMTAAQIAKELDAGVYDGPKTVTVRPPSGVKG